MWIDAANTVMYFTRVETDKKKEGVGKIYKSSYANGKWGEAEAMPWNSENYTVGQPTISPDGSTMNSWFLISKVVRAHTIYG